MENTAQFLTALGGLLLLGLATIVIGRRTRLPRVTLLLVFGIFIGKQGVDLVPAMFTERFELIATMALLMVGFLIGGRLSLRTLRQSADRVLWISLTEVLVTILVVSCGLMAAGLGPDLAILLGCVASTTTPAATVDIVLESGKAGPASDLLLSVVALDDVWGLALFSVGVSLVGMLGGTHDLAASLAHVAWEIGGAVMLGLIMGLPGAYLTGRLRPGQPMLTEALGLVFLCGGLAVWMEVSYLIASMIMGATITNLARHHEYPFHAIEGVEWPFIVVFFTLAGASLDFSALQGLGLIAVLFILFRAVGKTAGGMAGARLARADTTTRRWMGLALLPQGGASMGMALMAATYFPQFQQTLLSVLIPSVVVFELLGPVLTGLALRKWAESPK